MKHWRKLAPIGIALALAAVLVTLFRAAPVSVETISIERGPMQEVVEDEGKTRMHDHFVVAAEVPGRVRRIDLDAGEAVRAGQTLAWIDPAPIDPRQRAVLEARLSGAQANQLQAEALVSRDKLDYFQTQKDLVRGRELFKQGIISKETLDKANTLNETVRKQLQAAESAAESSRFQVEEAKSALLVYKSGQVNLATEIKSPVDGRVLRLIEQSEHVVVTGAPLLEIGFTPRLEIVADFLTRDAVRIRPGMPVVISDWGGDSDLPARVRMVEPGGFTKISALGVEEQRVNVICDPIGRTDGLQDGFHVLARVILWKGDNVLRVPTSAVFRSSGNWAAFAVKNGRARKTPLQIGHRGDTEWELLDGLSPGDRIIVHPSAEIVDGGRVKDVTAGSG